MSYFIFGVIGDFRRTTTQRFDDDLEFSWGVALLQANLRNMLAAVGKPSASETAFSVAAPGKDQAGDLLDPFELGKTRVIGNVLRILGVLERERGASSAELWLTLGSDTDFPSVEGALVDIEGRVRGALTASHDIPSLRILLGIKSIQST